MADRTGGQVGAGNTTDRSRALRTSPQQKDLRRIADNCGKNWKKLLTYVGLKDTKIQECEINENTISDACFAGLVFWLGGNANDSNPVNWNTLLTAMEDAGMAGDARKWKEKIIERCAASLDEPSDAGQSGNEKTPTPRQEEASSATPKSTTTRDDKEKQPGFSRSKRSPYSDQQQQAKRHKSPLREFPSGPEQNQVQFQQKSPSTASLLSGGNSSTSTLTPRPVTTTAHEVASSGSSMVPSGPPMVPYGPLMATLSPPMVPCSPSMAPSGPPMVPSGSSMAPFSPPMVPYGPSMAPNNSNETRDASVSLETHSEKEVWRIQKQLVIILHAHLCLKRERHNPAHTCTLQHCGPAKDVLMHMTTCQELQNCQFPHCVSYRRVLMHWKQCRSGCCDICMPLRSTRKHGNTGRQL